MRKPTLIYGLTALVIFATSFFDFGSIDIALHDTYFVIANSHLLKFLSLYYFILAFIAWIIFKLGRRLSMVLIGLHYLLSLVFLFGIISLMNPEMDDTKVINNYSVYDDYENYNSDFLLVEKISLVIIFFLFTQLLIVVNWIRSFILKKE